MALIPRVFENSVFDSFFGSSIFDQYDSFSRSFFNHSFPSFDNGVSAVANTRVDWVETADAHVFKADLPGMKKEEIKILVADDGILSISGERTKELVGEKDSYRREERSFDKFNRQFRLPSNTKPQDISAKVEHGVLIVTVPKTEESKRNLKFEMWKFKVRDRVVTQTEKRLDHLVGRCMSNGPSTV